jgi:hypothetical protein
MRAPEAGKRAVLSGWEDGGEGERLSRGIWLVFELELEVPDTGS